MKIAGQLYNYAFFFFAALAGSLALALLQTDISLQTFLQIIAFSALLILGSTRILFPKIRTIFGEQSAYLIEGFPVLLFSYLLIFATGGISSPFVVITHFATLAISFLLSPHLALGFVAITILFFGVHVYIDFSAQAYLAESPFAVLLYFIAYLALVPIAYVLAKQYKIKEEWVGRLEKQLATSKRSEEELLKNIVDPVFVLNRSFDIVYLNRAATDLTTISSKDLGNHFFQLATVKDEAGKVLDDQSLSFVSVLASKEQAVIENIQFARKGGFGRVDLKILPVISEEGESLGLVLIIKDHKEKKDDKKKGVADLALSKFAEILARQKSELYALESKSPGNFQKLSQQTDILESFTQDFVYTLQIEAGEVGAISEILDLAPIVSGVIERSKGLSDELSVTLEPKGKLTKTNILGNISWMDDALLRIVKIALSLCQKGGQVSIELLHEKELVRLQVVVETKAVPKEKTEELFEKFYGSLTGLPSLVLTTGLEGYIARNLIERMGGKVSTQIITSPPLLVFAITFATKPQADIS